MPAGGGAAGGTYVIKRRGCGIHSKRNRGKGVVPFWSVQKKNPPNGLFPCKK